jgi:hypothetical protein
VSLPLTRPIDPLRRNARAGCYEDDLVVVTRGEIPGGVRTEHFSVLERDGRLHVAHRLDPATLDDGLAVLLAGELFAPGWVVGAQTFERIFTGTVLSSGADPLSSWELFYRNTLARGPAAGFAAVHHHALGLIPPGTTLDLGSCFGFLPLMLAGHGRGYVIASDVSAGTMGLLAAVAPRLGTPLRTPLRTMVADAARVPLPDASVDTVTAVHLLEHLDAGHGAAVVTEALRLARRRVVIAVPYEPEPDAAFGHVRSFDTAALAEIGKASGVPWSVEEAHGGWLVLQQPQITPSFDAS